MGAVGAGIVSGIGAVGTFLATHGATIMNAVGMIGSWISGTDHIDDAPAYNEKTATVDETSAMNSLLKKMRNKFKDTCFELENSIQKDTNSVFGNILASVDNVTKETGIPISVDTFKREFDIYLEKMKDNISGMVTRRITLSDSECAEILKSEASENRSAKLDQFLKKIVREGFEKSEDNFSEIIDSVFSWVKDRIDEKIQEKQISESNFLHELEDMKRELTNDELLEKEAKFKREKKALEDLIGLLDKSAA